MFRPNSSTEATLKENTMSMGDEKVTFHAIKVTCYIKCYFCCFADVTGYYAIKIYTSLYITHISSSCPIKIQVTTYKYRTQSVIEYMVFTPIME